MVFPDPLDPCPTLPLSTSANTPNCTILSVSDVLICRSRMGVGPQLESNHLFHIHCTCPPETRSPCRLAPAHLQVRFFAAHIKETEREPLHLKQHDFVGRHECCAVFGIDSAICKQGPLSPPPLGRAILDLPVYTRTHDIELYSIDYRPI